MRRIKLFFVFLRACAGWRHARVLCDGGAKVFSRAPDEADGTSARPARSRRSGGVTKKKTPRFQGVPQKGIRESLFELIPVFLLDEGGQRTTIFRLGLERIACGRAFAVLDGFRDFGLDFLFRFDVVETVFHGKILLC